MKIVSNNKIESIRLPILFLITSIQQGGAENVVFSICEFLKNESSSRFSPILIEMFKSSNTYSDMKRKELEGKMIGWKTLGFGNKYVSLVIAPLVLLYYIKKYKPKIIHSHTDLPDFVLSTALRFIRKPHFKILRTVHSSDLWPTHPIIGRFTERGFKDDYIVAVSNYALESYVNLRNKYQLKTSHFKSVIYNGCQIPVPEEHLFKIDKQKINIVFAGKLELLKGIDIIISVIRELSDEIRSNFRFHIIGSGKYEYDVKALSAEFSNVIIYKPVSNLANKLKDFDLLWMPSRVEGLGLLSIEASLSYTPVISSLESKAIVETLPIGWPFLTNSNNGREYTRILKEIYEGKHNFPKMKNKAFEFVRKKFTMEEMNGKYYSLFFKMVNNGLSDYGS